MTSQQSNLDTLLLALPIVAMLFMVFFRLDELLAKPRLHGAVGHPLSHRDKDGQIICIEPDGHYWTALAGGHRARHPRRVPGHWPRRSEIRLASRVSVEWREGSED